MCIPNLFAVTTIVQKAAVTAAGTHITAHLGALPDSFLLQQVAQSLIL